MTGTSVTVEIPPGLDSTRTRRWLEEILGERATIARLRAEIGGQDQAPGPGVMAQIGRLEAAWRDIEKRYGLLSADDLVRMAGATPASLRTWVHNQRRRHGLLAVRRGGRNVFPGFQFTKTGSPKPWLREITEPLLAAGWSEESVLLWLAAPTGWLSGQAPLDVVDTELDRVRRAAAAAAAGPVG